MALAVPRLTRRPPQLHRTHPPTHPPCLPSDVGFAWSLGALFMMSYCGATFTRSEVKPTNFVLSRLFQSESLRIVLATLSKR